MDFSEALSKYTSPEQKPLYTNRTPLYIVVTIEAMQTKTGEDFAFGKGSPDIRCDFFELRAASFLTAPGEEIIGFPSNGAEVWINVSTEVVNRVWVQEAK